MMMCDRAAAPRPCHSAATSSPKRRSPVVTAVICARRSPMRALGQAHVHGDDVDEFLVDDACALILHDRDLDAFGEDVRRDLAERAADIEPMRHAAGERDQLALVEDRHREGEVVEMAAGGVGVVGDEDVAGLDVRRAR